MKTIKVNYGFQPILHIDEEGMGLNRDRNPDNGWSELRRTRIENNESIKEVELTPKMKQILIEDLAYAYGNDSTKFSKKLKEFELI